MLPGFCAEAELPAHACPELGLLHDQSTRASDVTPSRRGERGESRETPVQVPCQRVLWELLLARGILERPVCLINSCKKETKHNPELSGNKGREEEVPV